MTNEAKAVPFAAPTKKATCYMQHWAFVSNALSDCRPDPDQRFDYELWKKLAHTVAHDFSKDNPRFSKTFFFTACGMEPRQKKGTREG